MPRPDRWHRDPGSPFDDYKREEFAKARAKGGTIRAAANHVGLNYQSALEYEKHPEMIARIRELRGGAENFVGVSVAWVLQNLKQNVEIARENNQLKSSNEALELIYKIVTTNADVAANTARALPPNADIRAVKKKLLESLTAAETAPEPTYIEAPTDPESDDEAAQ